MHADVMELKSSVGKLNYKTCLKMEKKNNHFPHGWFRSISYPRSIGVTEQFHIPVITETGSACGFEPATRNVLFFFLDLN